MKKNILLPGLNKQVEFLLKNLLPVEYKILIIGPSSVPAALLLNQNGNQIELIVETYESFMNSKLDLKNEKNVNIRIMEFDNTDFPDEYFDLIYAQSSITNIKRNKILKEIKRILKNDGYFCTGEIVLLKENYPAFIKDILNNTGITPVESEKIVDFYKERNFKIQNEVDLSYTLKIYYEKLQDLKQSFIENMDKKNIKRLSHEINAFLKFGGEKYLGFKCLFLKKK